MSFCSVEDNCSMKFDWISVFTTLLFCPDLWVKLLHQYIHFTLSIGSWAPWGTLLSGASDNWSIFYIYTTPTNISVGQECWSNLKYRLNVSFGIDWLLVIIGRGSGVRITTRRVSWEIAISIFLVVNHVIRAILKGKIKSKIEMCFWKPWLTREPTERWILVIWTRMIVFVWIIQANFPLHELMSVHRPL